MQYYRDLNNSTPLTAEESDALWASMDRETNTIYDLLFHFLFILDEHIRLAEQCTDTEAIPSLFWESLLPEECRKTPYLLLQRLPGWKSEIQALRQETLRVYSDPLASADKRAEMAKRAKELLSRYPAAKIKLDEWFQLAHAYFTSRAEESGESSNQEIRLTGDESEDQRIMAELEKHIDVQTDLKNRIVQSHLRLVVSILNRIHVQPQNIIDLIQEGNLGLIKALERFDYKLGHRFTTYATWWIRHNILHAISSQTRVIHIPPHMYQTIMRIRRAEQNFIMHNGFEPSSDQLAAELEMPAARVRSIRAMAAQQISLQMQAGSDENSLKLEEIICDSEASDPEQCLAGKQLQDGLADALKTLSEREQLLLRLHFGLDGKTPKTVSELSKIFALSKERIRQIERGAFQKLRQPKLISLYFDSL